MIREPIGMYARTLRKDDQTHRFTISDAGASGWEVREEDGEKLVKRVVYSDWHRVERARMAFLAFAAAMTEAGWVDA